jgi:periplasmic divalent cation tolerance protein
MLLKTTKTNLPKLKKLVSAKHPYDTPEFLVLPLSSGNSRYLRWLSTSCSPG